MLSLNLALGLGGGSGGGGGGPTDPNYANVLTLLHFDGADGSTTITDNAPTPLTWVTAGNAQLDTAQSKFGGSSLLLDGTSDELTVNNGSVLDLSGGDFTIEAWIRLNSTGRHAILTKYATAANGYLFDLDASTRLRLIIGTGSFQTCQGASSLTTGTWYHVAATLSGTSMRVFLDGVVDGTATLSGTPVNTGSHYPRIGRDPNDSPGRDFDGWIDDFRVTGSVARYTANFTPPTAAFPNS